MRVSAVLGVYRVGGAGAGSARCGVYWRSVLVPVVPVLGVESAGGAGARRGECRRCWACIVSVVLVPVVLGAESVGGAGAGGAGAVVGTILFSIE